MLKMSDGGQGLILLLQEVLKKKIHKCRSMFCFKELPWIQNLLQGSHLYKKNLSVFLSWKMHGKWEKGSHVLEKQQNVNKKYFSSRCFVHDALLSLGPTSVMAVYIYLHYTRAYKFSFCGFWLSLTLIYHVNVQSSEVFYPNPSTLQNKCDQVIHAPLTAAKS